MSAHGISALERGYRRRPQFETLTLLAGALALSEHDRREFVVAAGSESARRAGSVTVGPWAGVATSSFPAALTSFVGREAELEEIRALMREQRMVTLTGPGGIGKTRTATQIARDLGDARDGAICFVAFAPIGDPSLVAATIASTLGVQEMPNRPLIETLRAYLRNKSLLLMLDNCEHVIEQAAIMAEALLDGCPRVRILATSRERLRAAGERAYRLHPLSANDAVSLFADRACAVDHRFAVTTENAPEIEQICRNVDGMPLAIELAAARVNVLSVKALAAKLDDRLGTLSGGERTADPRMQAMRATIDWSYRSALRAGTARLRMPLDFRRRLYARRCDECLRERGRQQGRRTSTCWRHWSTNRWSWRSSKDTNPDIGSSNHSVNMRTNASSRAAKIRSSLAVTPLRVSTLWSGRATSRSANRNALWAGLCVGEQHNLRAAMVWSLARTA